MNRKSYKFRNGFGNRNDTDTNQTNCVIEIENYTLNFHPANNKQGNCNYLIL